MTGRTLDALDHGSTGTDALGRTLLTVVLDGDVPQPGRDTIRAGVLLERVGDRLVWRVSPRRLGGEQ